MIQRTFPAINTGGARKIVYSVCSKAVLYAKIALETLAMTPPKKKPKHLRTVGGGNKGNTQQILTRLIIDRPRVALPHRSHAMKR